MNLATALEAVLSDPDVTDIHFTDGGAVWIRSGRSLIPHPEGIALEPGELNSWLADNHFHNDPIASLSELGGDADFAYSTPNCRLRAQAFLSGGRLCMAMRRLSDNAIEFSQLGLPEQVLNLAVRPRGVFLVTGQTGSGKSTTLASIINHLNRNEQQHIITIEDPVEYLYENDRCLITQREVKRDTTSYVRALRAALREDPDTILIGEIRDRETMEIALSAAETGHLVLATLHTNGAAATVERVASFFEGSVKAAAMSVFGSVINGIVCQQRLFDKEGKTVIVPEVMVPTDAIRNNIRKSEIIQIIQAMRMGSRDGQLLFDTALRDLMSSGRIDYETACFYATEPDQI